MKAIDEIYKEWCGADRLENSVKEIHDSTETIEFAEYYHNEMKQINVSQDVKNLGCDKISCSHYNKLFNRCKYMNDYCQLKQS